MAQSELLRRVAEALDEARIEYMVTGSLASSLQGEPRATHGIDLVVRLVARQVKELARRFPGPRYYLSEVAAREAVDTEGMFNLLEAAEGDKVDFWLLTEDPFYQSRFSRRYVEEVLGLRLSVSSPEDTILRKLRWSLATGGREQAFTDALRVYEVQRGGLDLDYLDSWAPRIGVSELLERMKREAEPL
jgi:hypothetical protein